MSEPTAWINKERDVITFDNLFPEMTPLYEKREWVGLTDDELFKIWMGAPAETEDRFAFVNAVIAKLKELNT